MSSRRGQGMVYRPTYRDKKTGKKKQQKVWWVQYSIGGKRERESTGTTVQREASASCTNGLPSADAAYRAGI